LIDNGFRPKRRNIDHQVGESKLIVVDAVQAQVTRVVGRVASPGSLAYFG
jgi:hypothetical protein